MMPDDGLEQIRNHDAIFLGAVGFPGVPDHVSLWGLLIPIRRQFDQYVNLRPVRLMPGVRSPLADRGPATSTFCIVRENNEGEYSSIGGRHLRGHRRRDRDPGDRSSRAAASTGSCATPSSWRAPRPKRHLTSATKSNGITITMPFWDERVKAMARAAIPTCGPTSTTSTS